MRPQRVEGDFWIITFYNYNNAPISPHSTTGYSVSKASQHTSVPLASCSFNSNTSWWWWDTCEDIYTDFLHIYMRAYLCSRALLCSDYFFILFLLWTSSSCSSTFVANFWHEKKRRKDVSMKSVAALRANVRKAGIFYWTSAIYSGSNIRKCLYPNSMLTTTIKILLMTSCAHIALKTPISNICRARKSR
jgi:hypothetical protein